MIFISEIKLKPGEREATFLEMMKTFILFNAVILIFIFVFFIPMSQGMMFSTTCGDDGRNIQTGEYGDCETGELGSIDTIIIGYSLTGCFVLILVFIWYQVFLVITRKGKVIMTSEGSMEVRTSNSEIRKSGRLSSLSRIVTSPIARLLINESDIDGDGKISFDEFIDANFSDMESKSEFQEMKDEFDRYDVDGDGYITLMELENFLSRNGENQVEEKSELEEKPDDWWSE